MAGVDIGSTGYRLYVARAHLYGLEHAFNICTIIQVASFNLPRVYYLCYHIDLFTLFYLKNRTLSFNRCHFSFDFWTYGQWHSQLVTRTSTLISFQYIPLLLYHWTLPGTFQNVNIYHVHSLCRNFGRMSVLLLWRYTNTTWIGLSNEKLYTGIVDLVAAASEYTKHITTQTITNPFVISSFVDSFSCLPLKWWGSRA